MLCIESVWKHPSGSREIVKVLCQLYDLLETLFYRLVVVLRFIYFYDRECCLQSHLRPPPPPRRNGPGIEFPPTKNKQCLSSLRGKSARYRIFTQMMDCFSPNRKFRFLLFTTVLASRQTLYNYWLGLRTTAVLFDPRTDLLPGSRRLRTTDPFEGQTKLLLSEKPV